MNSLEVKGFWKLLRNSKLKSGESRLYDFSNRDAAAQPGVTRTDSGVHEKKEGEGAMTRA